MTFEIPACNMETLKAKLSTIEKKAKKYNCEFNFTVEKEIFKDIKKENSNETFPYKFFVVNVSGKALISDWQFVAKIEHTTNGNIISGLSDYEIPVKYQKVNCICEHCKTNRQRKETFIVYNSKTNDYKQLGKACLKDYTNGLSAESVAQFESFFHEIEINENDFSRCINGNYLEKDEILKIAAETIEKYGYYNSSAQHPTKYQVLEFNDYFQNRIRDIRARAEIEKKIFSAKFNKENPANIELIKSALQWINSIDTAENNFLNNLKIVCSMDYIERKHIGLICALFPAYKKAMEIENAKKIEKKESNFIGNIKEKVSVNIKECKLLYSFDNVYGTTFVYSFKDESGNILIWKTQNYVNTDIKNFVLCGTVKNHNEYNGIKQTELTRCKIKD